MIPKSGITFPGCLAGGITAPASLPPAPALSGPCALTSQIKLLNAGSASSTPPQDVSSTKLSCLTPPSFMYTSQLPWHHWLVVRVECKNVCYTCGSSFSWMLCRCLGLHSLNQGIMLLLMLVSPLGVPFTGISNC